MTEFKIIKNALCLTFDSLNRIGKYTIILKGNRIFDIEYNNSNIEDETLLKKYPTATVYDAENKILVPSFLNSFKNSSYILSGVFFRNVKYDDLTTNLSLRLIDNYFLKNENSEDLLNLFRVSFLISLINGECFVNESSAYINSDLILNDSFRLIKAKPNIIFTVYDNYLSDYILGVNRFHCLGIKEDEDLNNYSINSIKSSLSRGNKRAIIEVYQSANSSDTLRSMFGKSFVRVLLENDLLSGKVIFSNPVYLSNDELAIISDKNSNILIQPADWIRLSQKIADLEKFFSSRNLLPILIGTGYLGKSVFSQIKLLYSIIPRAKISAESLLRLITVKPAEFFNISNICGSIEKNKLANFVLFDLSDIRNTLNIPEINNELISEFILENLNEKDISDVFFYGVPVIEDYKSNIINFEEINNLYSKLLNKIYDIGRYFDFKEKILMTERVEKLSLGNKVRKERQYVSLTGEAQETYDEDMESDFRIVGTYRADVLNGIDEDVYQESHIDDLSKSIKEINSLNKGFDFFKFFEEAEYKTSIKETESEKTEESAVDKKIKIKKKIYFDDTEYSKDSQNINESKSQKSSFLSFFAKSKDKTQKVKFKKDKMRFGFDDE